MNRQKQLLDQAEWLCSLGFDHTAHVVLHWDDPRYQPLPAPQDAVVTKMAGSGIFPAGPS